MTIGNIQTIVFQCATCGVFYFDDISPFEFSGKKEISISCKCNKNSLKIAIKRRKQMILSIPCFLCNETHTYIFSINQMFSDDLKVLKCPKKNMKIGFIGNESSVSDALDCHENALNDILKEMGMPRLCKNIEVVIESINYIHDLAEEGKIRCECGNNKLEMDVLTNKIKLKCYDCGNEINLPTRNNEDLRYIHAQSVILLQKNENVL
ncbi:MAG: hypothetical protein GX308_07675 [Epulopiscium sp.]|nr:hypothetical protein [Candidatus Epulonipiscium sp.]